MVTSSKSHIEILKIHTPPVTTGTHFQTKIFHRGCMDFKWSSPHDKRAYIKILSKLSYCKSRNVCVHLNFANFASTLSSRKFLAGNIFIVPSTMQYMLIITNFHAAKLSNVADSQKFKPVNISGFTVLPNSSKMFLPAH